MSDDDEAEILLSTRAWGIAGLDEDDAEDAEYVASRASRGARRALPYVGSNSELDRIFI